MHISDDVESDAFYGDMIDIDTGFTFVAQIDEAFRDSMREYDEQLYAEMNARMDAAEDAAFDAAFVASLTDAVNEGRVSAETLALIVALRSHP